MKKGNNIQGIGNDILEIERIRRSIERHGQHFLDKLFTQKEQRYCLQFKDFAPHFAGRFSAKEAVAKALGVGIGKELSWKDVEILANEQGGPEVSFSAVAKEQFGGLCVFLSISHSETHATAVALIVKMEEGS